jgi:hypothetical protein
MDSQATIPFGSDLAARIDRSRAPVAVVVYHRGRRLASLPLDTFQRSYGNLHRSLQGRPSDLAPGQSKPE